MFEKGIRKKNEAIFSEYSKLAELIRMPSYFYTETIKLAKINHGSKILDIGCGNGHLLEMLSQQFTNAKLFGVEPSKKLFETSKNKLLKKALILNCIGEKTPFENEFFDIVFLTEVIEHAKKPDKILHEIKRILKKDGRIIVSFPNLTAYFPFYLFDNYIPYKLRSVLLPEEHPFNSIQPIDRIFTISEFKSLINRVKLVEEERLGMQYFPWLFSKIPSSILTKKFRTIFNRALTGIKMSFFAYRILMVLKKKKGR